MCIVIDFPCRDIHARTSPKRFFPRSSRAEKPASISTVTQALRATRVRTIDGQYSGGMRSRCDHLGTAATGAPVSPAMATCVGQSEITSRNERGLDIESFLGQSVLNDKAKVSCDDSVPLRHNLPMTGTAESAFKTGFLARVRAAREASGFSQEVVARHLDIPQDKYKHYETRSLMPHALIPLFLEIVRVDYGWLFTGKGRVPSKPKTPAKSPSPAAEQAPIRRKA